MDPLEVLRGNELEPSPDGHRLDVAIAPILREAIVSGALPSGTRLSEAQLAQRLGVSRTPVRQALNQLAHERLVVMVPRVGASVRTVTPEDVAEIYEVRIALEVLATKLMIQRMTGVGKAEMAEALNALRSAAEDPERYAKALDGFHSMLMRLAGNRTLVQIYESLVGPIRRFRRINLGSEDRVQRSLRANLRIGRSILAGDSLAATLMERHLQDACKAVIAVLRSQSKA
jgi:DNA-binding GntR family transcriptional regulator